MLIAFLALLVILLHSPLGLAVASPPRSPTSSPTTPSSPKNQIDHIDCTWYLQNRGPAPADCYAAISMIPSGDFLVQGDHFLDENGRPKLKIHIPPHDRARKFFMPAIFRSGTCMIRVSADVDRRGLMRPNPPAFTNAAAKMYSTVWPHVRQRATEIVQECLAKDPDGLRHYGGSVHTESALGDVRFPYQIKVEEPHKGFPRDGATYIDLEGVGPGFDVRRAWEVEYNVYEPGGTASGQGRKTANHLRGGMGRRPVYHGGQQ